MHVKVCVTSNCTSHFWKHKCIWPNKANSYIEGPAVQMSCSSSNYFSRNLAVEFFSFIFLASPHMNGFQNRGRKKLLRGVCFKSGFYLHCVSDFVLIFVLQQKQNREKISTMSSKVYISSSSLLIIKAVLFYNIDLTIIYSHPSPLTSFQALWDGTCILSRSCIAAVSVEWVCPRVHRCPWSFTHALNLYLDQISERQCGEWCFLHLSMITN